MTFEETLQVDSSSVMDHSFLETRCITGPKCAANAATDACTTTSKATCRTDDFANTIMQHDASLIGPEGIQYGQYVWEPTTVGKIDFLEMFSGSVNTYRESPVLLGTKESE
jgi:hypothetical protein